MKILEFYKSKGPVEFNSIVFCNFVNLSAQPGSNWLVCLQAKDIRSIKQNAYLWGHLYKEISEHTGYTPDEVHLYCKVNFLGYIEKEYHNIKFNSIQNVKELKSTTKLTKEEFTKFCNDVKNLGNEQGVTFDDFEHYIASNPEVVARYAKQYVYDRA